MGIPHLPTRFHSVKRTEFLLGVLTITLLSFWFYGMIAGANGVSFGLEDLPSPFVSSGGLLNCSVVVASSVGHGPCSGSHTMDVVGAIMVGGKFGLNADGSMLDATMDDYVSTYDFDTAEIELKDVSSNLVVVGGPGVNQIAWYYNNLRNETGNRILPVYFDKNPTGEDRIYVASSGNSYAIEHDALNRVTADYGVVTLFYDSERGMWVLIIAGLGGSGTLAASKLLASYNSRSLFGRVTVVRFADSDNNGYLDEISVAESVGFGESIDVYWDVECMSRVESIYWGTLLPGESKSVTIYVRNEGESGKVLVLNVYDWYPTVASNYLTVEWNYSGATVEPGQIVTVVLILTVDSLVGGITNFSVTIEVNSS